MGLTRQEQMGQLLRPARLASAQADGSVRDDLQAGGPLHRPLRRLSAPRRGEPCDSGRGHPGILPGTALLEASLATEAGRAFIQYAFGELGLTRLVAGTDAENLASNRVLVKLGFVCVQSGKGGGRSYHGYELRTQSQQTA